MPSKRLIFSPFHLSVAQEQIRQSWRKWKEGGERVVTDCADPVIGWFLVFCEPPLGIAMLAPLLWPADIINCVYPKLRLHYSTLAATCPSSPAYTKRQRRISSDHTVHSWWESAETLWFVLKSFKRIYKYSDWLLISFLICCLFSPLHFFFSLS